MARKSRAQTAAAAKKAPPPQNQYDSDEEMANGPQSSPASPQQDVSEDEAEENIDADEGEERGTPAVDSDAGSHPSIPAPGRTSILRKRRAGRPTNRGSSRRTMGDEPESRDTGSDVGTRRKRGGWRGRAVGGGRWGKPRGGPSHTTQVPLDKDGNMANVKDDEIELPLDEEGEQKVDENGYLKGGREYRVRTFSIEDKGDRLYMLSTEPARCVGFRDSYLFFQKHKNLYKIIVAEEAKKDLIERNLIPHSYKGRAIGVVTARSVFREFGARIIIGGRKITDDYQVQAARAVGDIEGEMANPEDRLPGSGEDYDKNQYVAWHGASAVYHTGAPSVPMPNGKAADGKKRKVIVTGVNWMFEHARAASRFNSSLANSRRQNLNGAYDVHTNVMQYPKIMQPTHARWEQVSPPIQKSPVLPNPANRVNRGNDGGGGTVAGPDSTAEALFPDIPPVFTRSFMITDTYYVTPVSSTLGYPGPDEHVVDVGPGGLTHISEHVLATLPEECRQYFLKARSEERVWKESWGGENDDSARAKLRITYNV